MALPKLNSAKLAGIKDRLNINKSWLIFLVAGVLGVSGVLLANGFIKGRIAEHEAELRAGQKLVAVVVPKHDLPRGARLAAEDLAVRKIPITFVHKGAVTPDKFTVAEGQRLTFQVEKGRPLLWAHLESGSIPTFSGKLPNGLRAITVPVDEINSISGLLQPKDKIDLFLTFSPYDKKMTIPLLQDVLVLATGTKVTTSKFDDDTGKRRNRTYTTVTLQATPKQAKMIILSQESGKMTAVLRHPDDDKELNKDYMTVAGLMRLGAPRRRGVEIIIGGQ